MKMKFTSALAVITSFSFALFIGCGNPTDTGPLFSSSSSSSSGMICVPGALYSCYDGPPETINMGQCRFGAKQCTETGLEYGFCQNQVLPKEIEICNDLIDNNCNGVVDRDCMPPCNLDADCAMYNETCRAGICEEKYCAVQNLTSSTQFNQIPGDCKKEACDGKGNLVSIKDYDDVPNIECYSSVCAGGNPINTPAPEGTLCTTENGKYCDGQGSCVECTVNPHCPNGKICQNNQCL